MNPAVYQVKAKNKNNEDWVIGYYCFMMPNEHSIITNFAQDGFSSSFINPETLCKCTGLNVKNDILLFENDILYDEDAKDLSVVKWDDKRGMFYLDVYGMDDDFQNYDVVDTYTIGDFTSLDHFEVIGNMKDGKELYDLLIARQLMEEEFEREGTGASIPTYPR